MILTASRKADDLVGDTRYDRQNRKAAQDAQPEIGPAEEDVKDDGDHHDDEQEIRSAARMQARKLLYVLDGQCLSCLVAVDGLVLRTVVLEDAADAAHERDPPDIEEEDHETDTALNEVEYDGVVRIRRREMCRSGRDNDKEDARKDEGKEDRHGDLLFRHLLVLLTCRLRGEREGAHPDDEGLHHDDRAADERQVEHRIAVTDGGDRACLDVDIAIWQAYCRRRTVCVAHHYALDDRLPTDGKIRNFLWHSFPLSYKKRPLHDLSYNGLFLIFVR